MFSTNIAWFYYPACIQCYYAIRYKLKRKGIHYSWDSIRDMLKGRVMITTSAKCKDGTMMYIRQCSQMSAEQTEIYDALISQPRKTL